MQQKSSGRGVHWGCGNVSWRGMESAHQYDDVRRHEGELREGHSRLLAAAEVLHLDGVRVAGQPEGAERLPRLLVLQPEQPLQVLHGRLLRGQVLARVLVEAADPLRTERGVHSNTLEETGETDGTTNIRTYCDGIILNFS